MLFLACYYPVFKGGVVGDVEGAWSEIKEAKGVRVPEQGRGVPLGRRLAGGFQGVVVSGSRVMGESGMGS